MGHRFVKLLVFATVAFAMALGFAAPAMASDPYVNITEPWGGLKNVYDPEGNVVPGWRVDTMGVDLESTSTSLRPDTLFYIKDGKLYGQQLEPGGWDPKDLDGHVEDWYVVDGGADGVKFEDGMSVGTSGTIYMDYMSYTLNRPSSEPIEVQAGKAFILPMMSANYKTTYTHQSGVIDFSKAVDNYEVRYIYFPPDIPGQPYNYFNPPIQILDHTYHSPIVGGSDSVGWLPMLACSAMTPSSRGNAKPGVDELKVEDWVPAGTRITFAAQPIEYPDSVGPWNAKQCCGSFEVIVTGQDEPSKTTTAPVYRLYNTRTQEHLYTTSSHERDVLASGKEWIYESVGWNAPKTGTLVYRVYNSRIDDHLYTDEHEATTLAAQDDWTMDNDGKPLFYSGGDVELYRLYHYASERHLITRDPHEYNTLPSKGWLQEGVKMHAVS